jgi:hypothetical protein
MFKQSGDGLGDASGSEDAGAEQGVSAEAIVENVLGSGDIGVNPRKIGELFECEGGDGAFVALADPLERQMITVSVERVW